MLAADTERESEREGGRERERGERHWKTKRQQSKHRSKFTKRGSQTGEPPRQSSFNGKSGWACGVECMFVNVGWMKEVALRQFKCDSLLHSIRCFNLHWKQQTDARSACLEEAPYCSGLRTCRRLGYQNSPTAFLQCRTRAIESKQRRRLPTGGP